MTTDEELRSIWKKVNVTNYKVTAAAFIWKDYENSE
jgi:hypothetical protein